MRVLIVLVLLARVAGAQPVDPAVKARADAAYAEGSNAYNASDFTRAALKFEEAYSLVADPAYLFNIAQAYRQAKDCVKAAAAFAKFIELVPAAPNIAKAKELHKEVNVCAIFVEGRRLMGAGRPAEACEKFAAAYKADPDAIGTLLNLGLCSEQIGKLATAAEWFRKAQNKAAALKVQEGVEEARQHLEGIAAQMPKVDIVVSPNPAYAKVTLDGVALSVLAGLEVDPGRHTVEVEAAGYRPQTKTFEIALRGRSTVKVELVALARPAPPSNRLAYVLGATGLTLWAGTAVLGFVARDKYDDAATFDEQRKWKNLVRYGGTSMFVVGTAAVTTSVVLYLRNRRHRSETAVVAPVVGAQQVGVTFGGSF
jgi:tetratricopeptide (TPR) repeat protein